MQTIAVIGLGYVGLPLAVEFGKTRRVIGYDIDSVRISELKQGFDRTNEVTIEDLDKAGHIDFTNDSASLKQVEIFIVTVPTPIDENKNPDLNPLRSASSLVADYLDAGNVVIYESTVYPGCTEEVCVPILEQRSGLKYNEDFFAGYSPERINPGDKKNRLPNIVKITSGSNSKTAIAVDELYSSIITAGTFKAESIKVAEAAKVIENTQRDVNIALVNELSMIFNRMDIDTKAVLEAAGTKWNFLNFDPGLVGGHCIGVDPYYLTHKALQIGHHPKLISAGREVNDGMPQFVVRQLTSRLASRGVTLRGSKVLIMGYSFKENCPDTRNTKVTDVVDGLLEYSIDVSVFDPVVDSEAIQLPKGASFVAEVSNKYAGVILAVAHREFCNEATFSMLKSLRDRGCFVMDIKSLLPREQSDFRL